MPVPELPRSSGAAGACSRDRPPATGDRRSPSGVDAGAEGLDRRGRVRATSSPSERPVMVEVPSASAASSRARWEIDLSPGTASGPDQRPAAADDRRRVATAAAGHRAVPTGVLRGTGSRGRPALASRVGAERASTTSTSTPAVALDRVGDLEVDDVDARARRPAW